MKNGSYNINNWLIKKANINKSKVTDWTERFETKLKLSSFNMLYQIPQEMANSWIMEFQDP